MRGVDEYLRGSQHSVAAVYSIMIQTICLEYRCLPDPRTLSMTEVRFFYEGIRPTLKARTADNG